MDCDFKIVLLGDKNVGKTTLYNQILYDEPHVRSTYGGYYGKRNFTINDDIYEAAIWDTAGEEKFHALTKIYFRGTDCALILFDLTKYNSWNAITYWINELNEASGKCGNAHYAK
eukprot:296313_1